MNMVHDALDEIIGSKVVDTSEHQIVFDNGIKIVCEDVGNNFDISGYTEDNVTTNKGNEKLDIAILLEMLASPDEPDFPRIEEIADKNGFYFDSYGDLRRKPYEGYKRKGDE